jgi:hypothetical protein
VCVWVRPVPAARQRFIPGGEEGKVGGLKTGAAGPKSPRLPRTGLVRPQACHSGKARTQPRHQRWTEYLTRHPIVKPRGRPPRRSRPVARRGTGRRPGPTSGQPSSTWSRCWAPLPSPRSSSPGPRGPRPTAGAGAGGRPRQRPPRARQSPPPAAPRPAAAPGPGGLWGPAGGLPGRRHKTPRPKRGSELHRNHLTGKGLTQKTVDRYFSHARVSPTGAYAPVGDVLDSIKVTVHGSGVTKAYSQVPRPEYSPGPACAVEWPACRRSRAAEVGVWHLHQGTCRPPW